MKEFVECLRGPYPSNKVRGNTTDASLNSDLLKDVRFVFQPAAPNQWDICWHIGDPLRELLKALDPSKEQTATPFKQLSQVTVAKEIDAKRCVACA